MADMQWYQTDLDVTVSLRFSDVDLKTVSGKFENDTCALLAEGKPFWSYRLLHPVMPKLCKTKSAGRRIELKLRKATAKKWLDLGIPIDLSITNNDITTVQNIPDNDITTVQNIPDSDITTVQNIPDSDITTVQNIPAISDQNTATMPITEDCNSDDSCEEYYSPSGSFDDSVSPKKCKIENDTDIVNLNNLQYDYTQKDSDGTITVKLQIPRADPIKVTVIFNRQSIELQFSSSDNSFLSSYPDSTCNTCFKWNIVLFDSLCPDKCNYIVTDAHILLNLTKHDTGVSWPSLIIAGVDAVEKGLNGPTNITESDTGHKWKAILPEKDNSYNDLNTIIDSSTKQSNLISNEFNPFKLASKATPAPVALTNSVFNNDNNDDQSICEPDSINSAQIVAENPNIKTSNKEQSKKELVHSSGTFYRLSPDPFIKPCLTGIANLGNTCFMSTVLQCLSNTIEVRDYFLGGIYKKDINLVNPLGRQGKLAECFCDCLISLWRSEKNYITPWKLKRLVGTMNDRFLGNSQQDAHEFVTFFLDALHEDVNRVKHKPQTKQIDSDNKSDIELANESWDVYRRRNDSVFIDLFGGQFKSTLVCPSCNKLSVTFDPFMSVSVPLPKKIRTLSVIFVSKDPTCSPRKLLLSLSPDGTLELLKASVARQTGITMNNLRVFEAYRGKFQKMMSDNKRPLSQIEDNDTIIVSEVLSRNIAKEKVIEISVIIRVQYIQCINVCSRKECTNNGTDLKRCTKCKTVAYCNRECQMKDWSEHKLKCKVNTAIPIAFPFMISLPASKVTYNNLTNYAEKCARWYIDYSKPTSTVQSTNINTMGAAVSIAPLYYLIPVDRFGANLRNAGPLVDTGDKVIDLTSQYLAMEWRNNPLDTDSVHITVKDELLVQKPVISNYPTLKDSGSTNIDLVDCLQLFTEPEELPADNAWYCPQCKEHREATKQMSIWRLPPVLIINLKRFSFQNSIWRDKIDKFVNFPLRGLDMSPYLLGEASTHLTTPPIYDLYATVNHYGSIYLGHYMATTKSPITNSNEWLKYDDELGAKIPSERSVQSKEAYILFYRRRTPNT